MIIPFRNFTGELPRLEAHLLPDNAARVSQNSDFTSGVLRGLRADGDSGVSDITEQQNSPQAIHFPLGSSVPFLWYGGEADACNSPVVNDSYKRMYWVETGKVKVTKTSAASSRNVNLSPLDAATYVVGCPQPKQAPEATVRLGIRGSSDPAKTLSIGSYTVYDREDGKLVNGFTIPLAGIQLVSDVSAPTIIGSTNLSHTVGVGARKPSQTAGTVGPAAASTWRLLNNLNISVSMDGLPSVSVAVPVYVSSTQNYCFQYGIASTATVTLLLSTGVPLTMYQQTNGWWWSSNAATGFVAPSSSSTQTSGMVAADGGGGTAVTTVTKYVKGYPTGGAWRSVTVSVVDGGMYFEDTGTDNQFSVADTSTGGGEQLLFWGRRYSGGAATKWVANNTTVVVPSGNVSVVPQVVETTPVGLTNGVVKYVLTLDDGTTATAEVGDGETVASGIPGVKVSLRVTSFVLPDGNTYDKMRDFRLTFFAEASESRDYVSTLVNEFGEEGPPSLVCTAECGESAVVTLKVHDTLPVDDVLNQFCPITKVRVYRTATGSQANYLYVGEVVRNTLGVFYDFKDTVPSDALGHTLDTYRYYPPAPYNISSAYSFSTDAADYLKGLCVMGNGILVGFRKNELHFSEPYLPYAFNPSNIKPLPFDIVGICPFDGGLYVITKGDAFVVQGAAPASMTDTRISAPAGINKKAICGFNGGAVYASHDGLVTLSGATANMDMSFKFWTRRDWQTAYSEGDRVAMRLASHDGMLLCWFAGGTSQSPFVIRHDEGEFSLTKLTGTKYWAVGRSYEYDALAVCPEISSGVVRVKNFSSAATTRIWSRTSKDFILAKPTHFSVCQIYGKGKFTVCIYGDDALLETFGFNNADLTRVNERMSPARARKFKVIVTATDAGAELHEMFLANSIQELRSV